MPRAKASPRRPAASADGGPAVDRAVAGGGGEPVDDAVRARVEPHLGVDLRGVRVHGDVAAEAASASIGARAFTYGADVFLGAGERPSDVALMAHELTHVAQQGAAGRAGPQALSVGAADHPAEREADAVADAVIGGRVPADGPRIVDDGAPTGPGQVQRRAFLDRLRPLVMAAADAELGVVGLTLGCPYIERVFAHYRGASAAEIERALQRFSGLPRVEQAADYIPPILTRLRAATQRWQAGEDVSGELATLGLGAPVPRRPAAATADRADASRPAVMRSMLDQLGPGQPLDPAVAGRIGDAMGADVSGARIHTDATAARMARSVDAAAFTVGAHVAFAPGTYQPGTPRGDALLAHELAHVVQQKGASAPPAAASDATVRGDATDEVEATPDPTEALTTERADAEADAEGASRGVIGRLYDGAGRVVRRMVDVARPVWSSEVTLQRCGGPEYEQLPEVTPAAPASSMPEPVTFAPAGDRFVVAFEAHDREVTFVIRYDGPHRCDLRGEPGRMTMRMTDEQFTRVATRPFAGQLVSLDDAHITIDLFGDGTQLATMHDRVSPGFDLRSRNHWFTGAMTSGSDGLLGGANCVVSWDSSGHGTPAPPGTPPGPTMPGLDAGIPEVHETTARFAGDEFRFTTQRLGTSNQIQLRIASAAGRRGINIDRLIEVPQIEHVTSTLLSNDGRDLTLDVNGDRQADVRLVHTIEQRFGVRTHHFRTFDSDGIFLDDQVGFVDGPEVAIPPDQDEATHAPELTREWPANRPPGQGDVAGELPQAIDRPGGVIELRVDGDGDRDKELVLRFHGDRVDASTSPPNVQQVRLELVQIASGQMATARLELDARHAAPLRPVVRDVADGLNPLRITVTDAFHAGTQEVMLELPPPTDRSGRRAYTATALGQALTFDLPLDTTATPSLVRARPPAADDPTGAPAANPAGAIGGIHYLDLVLGEYGDEFRFAIEPRGLVSQLSIAALQGGQPIAGESVLLQPRTVRGLSLVAGDPRQAALDVDGDGRADILVNDALSQGTFDTPNLAEPVDVARTHTLTVTGGALTARFTDSFHIVAGRWYRGRGFGHDPAGREAAGSTGAVTELTRQREEGSVASLLAIFDRQIAMQRHEAVAQGVITQAMYDAWNGMFVAMNQLRPAVLPSTGTATPADAEIQGRAAASAETFARLLTEATASGRTDESRDPTRGRGYRRRENPYTGEVDDVEGVTDVSTGHVVSRAGAPLEIAGDIRGGTWARAFQHMTRMTDGLDQWIADEMTRRFGPRGGNAAWQLGVRHELRDAEAHHPGARRVPAVFTADESYAGNSDYPTYRQLPLYLLTWRDGSSWRLRDITNPQQTFEDSHSGGTDAAPPAELFSELDYVRHFPRGVVRYDVPGGPSGRVPTTEHKTWSDYLGYAAMAAGAIALAATGVGLLVEAPLVATIAGGATVAAGALGAASAGMDIYERASHGHLDATTFMVDVVQIVAGLLTAGAASSRILVGRAVAASTRGQAYAGLAARAAALADRLYIPLTRAAVAADVVNCVVMESHLLSQLSAVQGSGPDRERAITAIATNMLAIGALTILSVRGSMPEIRAGGRPNIVIDFVDNIPIARTAGVRAGGAEIHVSATDADAHASARWQSHALEEAAAAGNADARAMLGDGEFMDWYRRWMAQETKIRTRPDGSTEVLIPDGCPPAVAERIRGLATNPRAGIGLYERSWGNAERIRSLRERIPDLDLDPSSAGWQNNRARVIAELGGDDAARDAVRRFEAARLGGSAVDAAGYTAERRQVNSLVPDTELDRIHGLFAGNDVYVTGSASQPGRPVRPDVDDVDVIVVVPADTAPELMAAMEQRGVGFRVRTDPDFNAANGLPADHTIGLDVKVMTPDQFFGWSTTPAPSGRTPLRFHSLGASGAPAAGSRQATAQAAFRLLGNDHARTEAVMAGLGDGHAKLDALITELGETEARSLAAQLGDRRFGRYVAATANGAELQQVLAGVTPTRLVPLEARLTPHQVVALWRASGVAGCEHFRQVVALEASGRVRGVADWVDFTFVRSNKTGADLRNAMSELADARNLARENPHSVVNVGGDARAPLRPIDPANPTAQREPMQSFDITVESPTGTVERSVEMWTSSAPVTAEGALSEGINHAAGKVRTRATDGAPIPGSREASITFDFDLTPRRPTTTDQQFVTNLDDGTIVFETLDDAGALVRRRTEDFYARFERFLARHPNRGDLDRVRLLGSDGRVRAVFQRTGTRWSRVP